MSHEGKTVLFCVLNWGLGHATRSIPIIRYLEECKCTVVIASDGDALSYLRTEFPNNAFYALPSYNVNYHFSPIGGTFISIPSIFAAIAREKTIITDIVNSAPIDFIVSDNRYGAFTPACPSYLITHQFNPFFFVKPRLLSIVPEWMFAKVVNNYSAILLPDDPAVGISGVMSLNRYVKKPVKWLGVLNRFTGFDENISEQSIDILVVLSGPEPARTLFENYIFSELNGLKCSIVVVLGRKIKDCETFYKGFDVRGFVDTKTLFALYRSANVVVSRSGYSSIMDYLALGISAILIPTPKMPEQEYLSELMEKKGYFKSVAQKRGLLNVALSESCSLKRQHGDMKTNNFIGVF